MSEDEQLNEDEQLFEKTEKCKIKFDKLGNITIVGDCNGEEVNRTELAAFNKVATLFEDENK